MIIHNPIEYIYYTDMSVSWHEWFFSVCMSYHSQPDSKYKLNGWHSHTTLSFIAHNLLVMKKKIKIKYKIHPYQLVLT